MEDKDEQFDKLKEFASIMAGFYEAGDFSIEKCQKCLDLLKTIEDLCGRIKERDDLTTQNKRALSVAEHAVKISRESIQNQMRLKFN